jgi:hypothetical protein
MGAMLLGWLVILYGITVPWKVYCGVRGKACWRGTIGELWRVGTRFCSFGKKGRPDDYRSGPPLETSQ